MSVLRNDRHDIDPQVLHTTTVVAIVAAIIVAVVPPVLHFYYAYQFERGSIASEATVNAHQVSQLAGRNPQLWEFETLRIDEFLGGHDRSEKKRIVDRGGELVTEVGPDAPEWPTISVSVPVFDAGLEVGTLQIAKSMRSTLQYSLIILAVSVMFACGVFTALRVLPLGVLRRVIDRAAFLASHDPLTDLPNRMLFNDWLANAIADAERQKTSLAILCLDLDHFKEVNDTLGHAAGDLLLRETAARMKTLIRSGDVIARLGGDEFAIIQKHILQPNGAAILAERLIAAMSEPFDLEGQEVLVGTSVGIAIHALESGSDGANLLQQGDLALYRSKAASRGSFCFFEEEMNEQLKTRKRLETELRKALAKNELQLHFQPQVNLAANTVIGVEALLRWNHPTDGWIPPDRFIPLAEETGLILPIGEWVMREACRQARDWPELTFSVNVSPVQFRQKTLVEIIKSALADAQIEPGRLEIEITEGVLLNNTEETIAILKEIQALGVRVAMDDFGTGYSSLSYLRRFAFDKIKIDQSFIAGLGNSADADSIIQAVITLGASLGMVSNAEGVETAEQADILRQKGCGEVQGYYYGRPMPSSSISEFLIDWEFQRVAAAPSVSRNIKIA